MLLKKCSTTDFTTFEQSLNSTSTSVPALQANATVSSCNYFMVGSGYQFTQADNDIGLVFLPNVTGGKDDLYYKNMNAPVTLGWDWSQLTSLVTSLSSVKCQLNNS